MVGRRLRIVVLPLLAAGCYPGLELDPGCRTVADCFSDEVCDPATGQCVKRPGDAAAQDAEVGDARQPDVSDAGGDPACRALDALHARGILPDGCDALLNRIGFSRGEWVGMLARARGLDAVEACGSCPLPAHEDVAADDPLARPAACLASLLCEGDGDAPLPASGLLRPQERVSRSEAARLLVETWCVPLAGVEPAACGDRDAAPEADRLRLDAACARGLLDCTDGCRPLEVPTPGESAVALLALVDAAGSTPPEDADLHPRCVLGACVDGDGDGYGAAGWCEGRPPDCDDGRDDVRPEHPDGDGDCDGRDDDCDGVTDNAFPVGEPCDGEDGDDCAHGTWSCTAGGLGVECIDEDPAGLVEACNGEDDDCDGGDGRGLRSGRRSPQLRRMWLHLPRAGPRAGGLRGWRVHGGGLRGRLGGRDGQPGGRLRVRVRADAGGRRAVRRAGQRLRRADGRGPGHERRGRGRLPGLPGRLPGRGGPGPGGRGRRRRGRRLRGRGHGRRRRGGRGGLLPASRQRRPARPGRGRHRRCLRPLPGRGVAGQRGRGRRRHRRRLRRLPAGGGPGAGQRGRRPLGRRLRSLPAAGGGRQRGRRRRRRGGRLRQLPGHAQPGPGRPGRGRGRRPLRRGPGRGRHGERGGPLPGRGGRRHGHGRRRRAGRLRRGRRRGRGGGRGGQLPPAGQPGPGGPGRGWGGRGVRPGGRGAAGAGGLGGAGGGGGSDADLAGEPGRGRGGVSRGAGGGRRRPAGPSDRGAGGGGAVPGRRGRGRRDLPLPGAGGGRGRPRERAERLGGGDGAGGDGGGGAGPADRGGCDLDRVAQPLHAAGRGAGAGGRDAGDPAGGDGAERRRGDRGGGDAAGPGNGGAAGGVHVGGGGAGDGGLGRDRVHGERGAAGGGGDAVGVREHPGALRGGVCGGLGGGGGLVECPDRGLLQNHFRDNEAGTTGGGLFLAASNAGLCLVVGALFEGNRGQTGGLHVTGRAVAVYQSAFVRNASTAEGGPASASLAGGLLVASDLLDEGLAVHATGNQPVEATGNWWGTVDPAEIAAKVQGDVRWDPPAAGPFLPGLEIPDASHAVGGRLYGPVWDDPAAPYLVYETAEADGLTVRAGVIVIFAPGAALHLTGGTVRILGAPDAPVLFRSFGAGDEAGAWGGVRFDPAVTDASFDDDGLQVGGSVVRHLRIAGATTALDVNGSSPALDNVVVEHSTTGLRTRGDARPRVALSTFSDLAGSAWLIEASSAPALLGCEVTGVSGAGDVVAITGTAAPTIAGCRLHDNPPGDDPERALVAISTRSADWSLTRSDLAHDGPLAVRVETAFEDAASFDLTGNWWGTADRGEIGDRIHDFMEDIDLAELVFEPFAEAPLPRDADGDGVADAEDSCPLQPGDPADSDGDGAGDACDACPDVPDPDRADTDWDGLGDACDVCPAVPDPDQADGDGDGAGDACDVCPDVPDPDQADADGDGDGDACDPCPAHPRGEDANGDGWPDVCPDDWDGDGVPNGQDNCPTTANPEQQVVDGDGDGVDCRTDCNDHASWVHPGAEERCNDQDDDCDGQAAGEAGCLHCEAFRIADGLPEAAAWSGVPVSSVGAAFVIVFVEANAEGERDLVVALPDPIERVAERIVRLPAADFGPLDAVAVGGHLHIATHSPVLGEAISHVAVDLATGEAGQVTPLHVPQPQPETPPVAIADGADALIVAWDAPGGGGQSVRVSYEGELLDQDPVVLAAGARTGWPQIAADHQGIYMACNLNGGWQLGVFGFDPLGERAWSHEVVPGGGGWFGGYDITHTRRGLIVAAPEHEGGPVRLVGLGTNGLLANDVAIPLPGGRSFARLAAARENVGLLLTRPPDVRFALLDLDGLVLDGPTQVAATDAHGGAGIAWSGRRWGVVWRNADELWFRQLGCPE